MSRCVAGVPAQSPYAAPVLAWRVHAALCDAEFVALQPRLSSYLLGADEVMRFDLARRSAGLLDQLLTYRTDWLAAWSAGRSALPGEAGASADEAWQAALWRHCSAELAGHAPAPLDLLARFGQALDGAGALPGLPAAAHVFALPTMAPLHTGLLQHLGQRVDVHVYVLNPCREYWFELVAPRQLSHLAASGREQGHEVGNRLALTVLVVDEASMLDLALATRLLETVPDDACIVLLGDKDQLAAVESGSVFADIRARDGVGSTGGAQAEQSSLAERVAWLEHNFRFVEDSGVGQLAGHIRAGRADEALATLRGGRGTLRWLDGAGPAAWMPHRSRPGTPAGR